jgi:hypothetical protein
LSFTAKLAESSQIDSLIRLQHLPNGPKHGIHHRFHFSLFLTFDRLKAT